MSGSPDLRPADLLEWSDVTARRWHALAQRSPELLAVPCDIRGVTTVAELLLHISAAELRYAEQLNGEQPTPYERLSFESADAILLTHTRAMERYRALLARSDFDWDAEFVVTTRSAGRLRATRRDVFLHALLHGIRHYAQLATLARHAGFAPNWPMDLLFLRAEQM